MIWFEKHPELLEEDKNYVNARGLNYIIDKKNKAYIEGIFKFHVTCNDIEFSDDCEIKIDIPDNYPLEIPIVFDSKDKFVNFHRNSDKSLCLGNNFELYKRFNPNRNIKNFLENIFVHFCYFFCFYKKFEKTPEGELSHGPKGIFEYYSDLFATKDVNLIIELLKIIMPKKSKNYTAKYRGHNLCPCNSGAKTRDCHGSVLKELAGLSVPRKVFEYEIENLKYFFKSSSEMILNLEGEYMSQLQLVNH